MAFDPRRIFDEIEFDNEMMERAAARPFEPETRRETIYLLSTLPAAVAALIVWSVGVAVGLAMALIIIGLPVTLMILWFFRRCAGWERSRLTLIDERPLEVVYAAEDGSRIQKTIALATDKQTWKDFGWLVFLSTIGLAVALIALSVWLVAFGWLIYPLYGWALPGDATPIGPLIGDNVNFFESLLMVPLGLVMIVVATWTGAATSYALRELSRVCLGSSQEDRLRGRVSELERTREETLTQQSTEMSRIERDLHDGAQARLVALAMDLGRAEQKFDDDPAAAKELVGQARDEAQRTLQDLRDLVRGIGPQILRDRGLEAALVPLAARSPIPVQITIDLDQRPGERVESTTYFVVSEALANAIKHSGAEKINVNAWRNEQWLYLRVSDNGTGRADADGEGLRGLRARVEAVDGRLMVDSPAGGPTIIDAWLPFH
ncbi:MAG: sensor domain-containing protein [Thermoleophilaceae bacterium]|nr:sensor domain-containing protein [Thermoleophilaceae bacterium]